MIKYSILAVDFLFGDSLSESKIRPVACLTNPIGKYDEIMIAYITTKIPFEKLITDLVVEKSAKEF